MPSTPVQEKGDSKDEKEESEELSLFWIDRDLELDGINLTWYLETEVISHGTKRADIKVYKAEATEAEKIHDEVILELLTESAGDICTTLTTPQSTKKKGSKKKGHPRFNDLSETLRSLNQGCPAARKSPGPLKDVPIATF